MFGIDNIIDFVIRAVAILISLTVHEVAHGYSAYKLGDPTAKAEGRLSFNPMHHIDPMGFFCLLFLHFGWAKPVMVNPGYFKSPKYGMAITSLMGPISNFALAFVSIMIYVPLNYFAYTTGGGLVLALILDFIAALFSINLVLMVFNLLPIPPLDGSKVFSAGLPNELYYKFISSQAIGNIFFILLIASNYIGDGISQYILGPPIDILSRGLQQIAYGFYAFVFKI